jgi:acyl-CoA reductase-like NAD-dependent aldehyde dehydrogenase
VGPDAQPLWSLVPVAARARYLRRAAVAMLDDPGDLDVTSELLPAVRALNALADEGPRVLADRRARRAVVVSAPVGRIVVRGPSVSAWREPVLEVGAALLAGNAVALTEVAAAPRLRAVFARAGVPAALIADGADGDRVIDLPRQRAVALVLPGARVSPAALRALEVIEASDTEAAIALVPAGAPVSIWARDDAQAERVARRLAAPQVFINHHGVPELAPAERLARHVVSRRLARRPGRAPRLDPARQVALAELRYGREARRWAALRALVQRRR